MWSIRRDISNDVSTFSSTFTSFDNCMSKNICKIPFIVICVVGGLIIFSILWCFLRCCLCGYRCCACCCGGCGGRREKRQKQLNRDISQPAPIIGQQPAYHEPPQYAYFDSRNDDALPVMPSLEKTQRIEISVKDELELAPMRPVNVQDSKGYAYDQPQTDPQHLKNNLQHPIPVQGYGQTGYRFQITDYQENLSPVSSTYSNIPPTLQGLGYQESGTLQYRNNGYQESPEYLQQPQLGWNGHRNTVQNAYNDYQTNPYQYQGSQHQHHPDASNHHSQRRQEEWTVV